jgi:hypothetical protein
MARPAGLWWRKKPREWWVKSGTVFYSVAPYLNISQWTIPSSATELLWTYKTVAPLMKQSLSLLLVSALTIVPPALGWGSRIESVKSTGRLSFTVLRAAEDDDIIDAYRVLLERAYNSYGETPAGFFGSDRVSQLRNQEHSPLLDSYDEWTDEDTMPCGEDCEVSSIDRGYHRSPTSVWLYYERADAQLDCWLLFVGMWNSGRI